MTLDWRKSAAIACMLPTLAIAGHQLSPNEERFSLMMETKHQLPANEVRVWLSQANIKKPVISRIKHPAEKTPWSHYKKIFITTSRIQNGAHYWKQHRTTLHKATEQFGVPSALIVAILGVESNYGKNHPSHRALDTLNTLAFYGEARRQHFFQNELAEFFILCHTQRTQPNTVHSSYAGAIGFPQFMPSSYRHYAYAAKPNTAPDLVHNHDDAIMSVANYFNKAHWKPHQPIAKPVYSNRVTPAPHQHLLALDPETQKNRWLVYPNFYVIMAYNHSINYAMTVALLAQEIKWTYDQNTTHARNHQRTAQKGSGPRGQILL